MNIKHAFTAAETLIVIVIIGIVSSCVLVALKPGDVKKDMLKKSGNNMLLQIDFATRQVLAKNSMNYKMTKLVTNAGVQFSINDSKADEKLIALYKRALIPSRNKTIPATYTAIELKNEANAKIGGGLKISSVTQGFRVKNGAYFAIKLNGNCTTNETYIYDPSAPEKRTAKKSCGLIFFDTNAEDSPNIVGVDEFIVPIGNSGLR